jgi:hypothetical protein
LEGTSKRGKESLRAQVNHLRGRIAELRRFPVRQDQDVGWLADPEAQAQIGEVRFSSFFFSIYNLLLLLLLFDPCLRRSRWN